MWKFHTLACATIDTYTTKKASEWVLIKKISWPAWYGSSSWYRFPLSLFKISLSYDEQPSIRLKTTAKELLSVANKEFESIPRELALRWAILCTKAFSQNSRASCIVTKRRSRVDSKLGARMECWFLIRCSSSNSYATLCDLNIHSTRADALHAQTEMPRFAQIRTSCKKHPRQAEAVPFEKRVSNQLSMNK